MSKPSHKPEFATNDVVDPTSGQNNAIEPPVAWKQDGWAYQEKPPRQYFNWNGRYTYQWIDHFDTKLSKAAIVVAASNASDKMKDTADHLCSGADDQVEIQAAIDEASANGGGIVLLSEGLFSITNHIVLASSISLLGQGRGSTVIAVENNIGLSFNMLLCSDRSNVRIENLSLQGGSQATNGHVGIAFFSAAGTAYYNLVRNVEIFGLVYHSGFDGIGILLGSNCADSVIENCKLTGNGAKGIEFLDTAAPPVQRVRVQGCFIDQQGIGDQGMQLSGYYNQIIDNVFDNSPNEGIFTDSAIWCTISGNIVVDSQGSHGISLNSSHHNIISNNQVVECEQHGIHVAANSADNIIQGNFTRDNNTSAGVFSGIGIEGDRNSISANISRSSSQKYGLDILAGADDNWVAANDFKGSGFTDDIHDVGTGTKWPLQGRYVSASSGGPTTQAVLIEDANHG